jgi:monoamine oxidase
MATKRSIKRAAADVIDVAVVGGGVSGAYACWRLKDAGREPVLFESSNRIGGRLWSIRPPGMPNLVAELGGMRFLTSHKLVVALAAKLQLKTAPFLTGDDNNIAYLRGVRLRLSDFEKHPDMVPYRLRDNVKQGDIREFGSRPGALLVAAINKIVPDAAKIDVRDWEKVKKQARFPSRSGPNIYNWGLWNMLLESDVLSSEAYALLLEGGGYESLADNWNCAEACQYLLSDFPASVSYRRFSDGFQGLPKTLASQFQRNGGDVRMRQTLRSFDASKGSLIEARFFDEKNKREMVVRAKTLILAMPQRRLQILAQNSPSLRHPNTRDLLDSVTAMPAFKMLLGYPNPWWEDLKISSGRSTTDLPVRQVYYVGTEKGMDKDDPANENSLLLASYADGRTESFWSALQFPEKSFAAPRGSAALKSFNEPYPLHKKFIRSFVGDAGPRATKALIATASRQLTQMHGIDIPPPGWASYADWTTDYGGGWHFWNPGLAVGDVIAKVRHPNNDVPIYICGEAYANEQGWVEGALKSAEHVLQDHLGVPPPNWLAADYYLGP